VTVDYVANARSLGCRACRATSAEELRDALQRAREQAGSSVIAIPVEPRRYTLESECWWDVGVAEVSERAETRLLAAEHAAGRSKQRHYAWPSD
jgi:TPP-dependent trihydroxycyclohexane-1,2-dione (THcHDO) dehydratase